ETAPAPVAPPEGLTAETLAAAMGNAVSLDRYRELLPGFAEAMRQAECTTPLRAAMWCAQIGHESGGLRYMEEIASGDAYDTRTDLGNTPQVDGDGRLFKGSGPIQLTGRNNFRAFSAWCHAKGWVDSPTYFEQHPQLVREDPRWGFLAATWYWTVSRPQINALADRQDLDGVTRAINGGLNGTGDRRERYARCLQLGAALIPRDTGPVAAIAAEAAAAAAWLGERTAEGDAADGGRYVHYTGGSIYWHPTTGAYAIPAALFEKYEQLGWERSYVGYPTERHLVLHEPEVSGEAWGDVQGFQGGAIYRRYGHPGHVVTGLIRAYWHAAGSETGRFGWPITDEQWADEQGGIRFQDFEHGRITWSATGTVGTHAEPGFDAIITEEN
ncbi:hypothetical protein M1M07_28465, partial [Rhodococcus sp. HM1]|nr:hypothetical protein [Rhodococcus sp. HM1]